MTKAFREVTVTRAGAEEGCWIVPSTTSSEIVFADGEKISNRETIQA